MNRHSIALLFLVTIGLTITSCKKDKPAEHGIQPKTVYVGHYSSDVLDKWMTMQIRLMRNATGIPNQAFSRHYVYAGIAALEALSPGMHGQNNWTNKWSGLAGLPAESPGMHYHLPANVNAALAAINRSMFPTAIEADKLAIDSLESALKQEYLSTENEAIINKSEEYGKAVAVAVFNWSESDGYKLANDAYTAPVGEGLWVPTAPAYAKPVSPYWGNNRPVIRGSIDNTQPDAPIVYSANKNSAFYQMVKQVYDVSQNLTQQQKDMAIFWRDVPGITSPGHWLSIVQQAVRQTGASLEKAAVAYALTGAAINDGLISCWKTKYKYNLVRPITYIRSVMGYETWNSYLTTPAHPEYSSAHAALSSAAGEIMEELFGGIGSFTDHTYDYLGFAPRTYSSFIAIGREAGQSRLFAGIHYQPSIDAGMQQGKKVADNILRAVRPNGDGAPDSITH